MQRAFRIAAATCCFGQPLKSAILTAGEIGVTGLQLDALHELKPEAFSASGRRQFLHRLAELGLSVASLNVPLRRTLYDRDHLDARIDAVKRSMTFAYQLNSKVVTARIGRIPREDAAANRMTLVAALNDLAGHGNHVGTVFTIVPSGDSLDEIAELLSQAGVG